MTAYTEAMRKVLTFLKRVYWWRVLGLLFAICAVDVLFQLGLPTDRSSSNARLGGIDIVSMTHEDIEHTIRAYEDSSYLYIVLGDETYIKRFSDIGITIDIASARAIADYDLKNKLIPFSALWRYSNAGSELEYIYDKEAARPFIEEIAAYGTTEPEPARFVSEGGRVGVVADIPGGSVDIEATLNALGKVEYLDRSQFIASTSPIYHELNAEKASNLASQANEIIDNPPTFVLGEDVAVTPPDAMADWFTINQDETGAYVLGLNEQAVGAYLDIVAKELFVPSVGAQVTLLDDTEITRVDGVSGKVLDKSAAYAELQQIIDEELTNSRVQLSLTDVRPGVTYERTYSRTNGGLSVFLKDIATRHGNVAISVQGIDLPSLAANYRGDVQMTAASTYKLYVGHYVLQQIEKGLAGDADKLASGRQIDYCLEQMLVVSSNSCAYELIDHFNVNSINADVRALGFGHTTIGPSMTTTNDLAQFLARTARVELSSQASYERMLDMLLRQKLKFGIPTGVSPAKAANKTGNVGAYEHDAAIVYGTQGRYAMTIMMHAERRSELAEIAREVHAFVESM